MRVQTNLHDEDPKPIEQDPNDSEEERQYEDVDQETLDKEFEHEIQNDDGVEGPHLLKDKEIEELLEKAKKNSLDVLHNSADISKRREIISDNQKAIIENQNKVADMIAKK